MIHSEFRQHTFFDGLTKQRLVKQNILFRIVKYLYSKIKSVGGALITRLKSSNVRKARSARW